MASTPYEEKLAELFGGDYQSMDASALLAKASGFAERGDISGMELSWAYDFILASHDSEETRREVASQINTAFNTEDTRPKALGCVRWLSEGHPLHEDVTAKKLESFLAPELYRVSVRQQVASLERGRNAVDAASPPEVLAQRIELILEHKKRKLRN